MDEEDVRERVRWFLRDRDAKSVTGSRRMSRAHLMDIVREEIEELYPEAAIYRIDDGRDPNVDIRDGIITAILLTDLTMVAELRKNIGDDPEDIMVFCTQELCHQVPVCIKGFYGMDPEGLRSDIKSTKA